MPVVDRLAPLREHAERNMRNRTFVLNEDGTTSSVKSGSVEDSRLNGGKPTLIPFVYDGRVVDVREAIDRAVESGIEFPAFNTNEEATRASRALSDSLFVGQLR